LSIVKSLVSLHSGDMTVHSKIDEGTTIIVALPIKFTPPAVDRPSSNIATFAHASRTHHQAHQGKKSA
jgi:cell cycle sensor histidine kinase DivJ